MSSDSQSTFPASNEVTAGRCPHGISLTTDPPCHFCDHQQYVEWVTPQLERLGREMVNNDRLREALQCLLPGLVLDLRYATDDDDKDAMQSRIGTVQDALAGTAVETAAPRDEIGYLIEMTGTGELLYWCPIPDWRSDCGGFHSDPNTAVRFARKADAERVLAFMIAKPLLTNATRGQCIVTEHMWYSAVKSTAPREFGTEPKGCPTPGACSCPEVKS